MSLKYRPEIDGLRTIAVLSVIVYHAEFALGEGKLLPGGFLGVDVFFVISGFLITSLILQELANTGSLSISGFYHRRVRRLLPALLVVMLASLPFAWLYLLPDQLIDYANSLLASLAFGSNFYWNYSLQQYGAESGLLKPFLHTWSLAVEEQFYLLYPLLLVAIHRWAKAYAAIILGALVLLSLAFAQWRSPLDFSFSFYMLPSRLWELIAGGLLAQYLHQRGAARFERPLWDAVPLIGILLIAWAVSFHKLNNQHPGLITVVPVLGTLMIIWPVRTDALAYRVLASRPFVYTGLISYALYLWHYPIFAFLRIDGAFETVPARLLAIAGTFLAASVSVAWLEKPFRSRERISDRVFATTVVASVLFTAAASLAVLGNSGFPDRFAGSLAASAKEMEEYRRKYWGEKSAYVRLENFSADKVSVEVIGNSWGKDIANALVEVGGYEVGFASSTGAICDAISIVGVESDHRRYQEATTRCPENRERFARDFSNADLVIIAESKSLLAVNRKEIRVEFLGHLRRLRDSGYRGPVLLISNRPVYRKEVFSIIREYGFSGDGVNSYAQRYLAQPPGLLRRQDERAAEFYESRNVFYYSLVDQLCEAEYCRILSEGMPLYHDRDHMTQSGARFVGAPLAEFIEARIFAGEPDR